MNMNRPVALPGLTQKPFVNRGQIAEMLGWTDDFESQVPLERTRLSNNVGKWLTEYSIEPVSRDSRVYLYDQGVIAAILKAAGKPFSQPRIKPSLRERIEAQRLGQNPQSTPAQPETTLKFDDAPAIPVPVEASEPLFEKVAENLREVYGTSENKTPLIAPEHKNTLGVPELLVLLGERLKEKETPAPVEVSRAEFERLERKTDQLIELCLGIKARLEAPVFFPPFPVLHDGPSMPTVLDGTFGIRENPDVDSSGLPEALLNTVSESQLNKNVESASDTASKTTPTTGQKDTTDARLSASIIPSALRQSRAYWESYVTPTELGAMLEPVKSAQAVNEALQQLGYQKKVRGSWIPNALGDTLSHSEVRNNPDGTTYTQLTWKRKVVQELIKESHAHASTARPENQSSDTSERPA